MTIVDEFPGLCCDDAAAGSVNKGDVGCGGDGQCAMAVGGSSKGEVCKGEEYTSLYIASCIQMAGLYADLCTGIAFCYLGYLYPIQPCKLIVLEELF